MSAQESISRDLELLGQANNPEALAWLNQIAPQLEIPTEFEVERENLTAVQVFVAMQTNWRIVAGMGGVVYQGLDYPALQSVANMLGIKRKTLPDLFDDIQIMEAAALPLLNEKSQGK